MVREKKGNYEKKKIDEIKQDNGKIMWNIIREKTGREKIEVEEKIYIGGVEHTPEEGSQH